MTRSRAIGAAMVVCALLVAALVWFVQFDGPRAERAVDGASVERANESTELAASGLAHTTPNGEARAAAAAVSESVAMEEAAATPEPPHLVISRAGAPLVGAHVELWSEPRDGEAQSFVFTSDADGRVPLPADMQGRGPWFALAGGAGACSRGLSPVRVDPLAASTDLSCADAQHVAIVFERSDGRATGMWEGHFIQPQLSRSARESRSALLPKFVTPMQTRCLVAAGLAESNARATWDMCVLTWGTETATGLTEVTDADSAEGPNTVTGTFGEPDTEEVRWSAVTVPLALGGALTRVAVPVLPDFAEGLVEVRFTGADAATILELADAVSVHLRPEGPDVSGEQVDLYVRWNEVPMARAQTLFRVPAGSYEAQVRLGAASLAERVRVVSGVGVDRDATTTIDFELPGAAILVFDEASRAALVGDEDSFVALLCDVDSGVGREFGLALGGRLTALVPAGRWVLRVQDPVAGLIVPAGRASDLAGRSAAHLVACRSMDSHYRDHVEMQIPEIVRESFIDARAGSEMHVEFVPDPMREEQR